MKPSTIAYWLKRIDTDTLVQTRTPVNKFPDFVKYIVIRLKTLCPTLGKRKIAQILARCGLHLGVTTVKRFLKQKPSHKPTQANNDIEIFEEETPKRLLKANYPNHLWNVDFSWKSNCKSQSKT